MPAVASSTMNSTIKKAVSIELEGRGSMTLKPADYVVSGGEGAIYKPSKETIIKLYHDTDKMIRDGMPQKLTLLSHINHPFIVSPRGLVYQNQLPIGYYMKFQEGESLAKVFTTSYGQRENFTDDDTIELVDGIRTTVQEAHKKGATMVDANELNWLFLKNGKTIEPRVIDVDSWKISHWDASVIMLSIHDWHTKGFNEGSDWFSMAIVSFQAFTGIHPYKGMLQGYKPNDIETRMKDNASVFTSGVRLNSAVRDFGCIPTPLLEWYKATFQNGLRCAPPSPKDKSITTPHAAIVKKITVQNNNGMVIIDLLYDGTSDAPMQIFSCGILRLTSGKLINLLNGIHFKKEVKGTCEIIQTEYGFLLAEMLPDNNLSFHVLLKDGSVTELTSILKGEKLVKYQNRLFVVCATGLVEVTVRSAAKLMLVTLNTWQVMLNSTRWYDGVGFQDALGAMFLITPYGDKSCEYVRVHELDGKKVISAIAGTRYVAATIVDGKTGLYQKYELVFAADYKSYQLTISESHDSELNMAILPKGVCASILEDGKMTIAVPVNGNQSEIADSRLETSLILGNWENKVVFIDAKKAWSISMKTK